MENDSAADGVLLAAHWNRRHEMLTSRDASRALFIYAWLITSLLGTSLILLVNFIG